MAETTVVLQKHFEDVKGNGKTMHTFLADDGRRYTTFNAQVAAQAKPLVGGPATISFTYKQNGQYENYYLDAAKAVNGVVVNNGEGTPNQVVPLVTTDARQASIQRQTALKAAVELAANGIIAPASIEEEAERFLGWIEGAGSTEGNA